MSSGLGARRRSPVAAIGPLDAPAPISLPMPGAVEFRPPRSRWLGIPPLLVALDLLAIAVGVLATELIGREVGVEPPSPQAAAFGAVLLALYWFGGLHRSRLTLSVLDDLPALVGRWLGAAAIVAIAATLWAEIAADGQVTGYLVDWRLLWGALIVLGLVLVLRAIGYASVYRLRARGAVCHPTVIVGAGAVGVQVGEMLLDHPEYGLRPVGFLDADPPATDRSRPLPVLGGPEALTRVLQAGVGIVIVAFSAARESETVHLIRTCDRFRCELFVIPRLFELHQVGTGMDAAWGLPLVRLRRATYRTPAWRVKRLVDVIVAGTALLVLAPVLAALAGLVLLDGGRGIIFRQERVGVDGQRFEVFKFRSLRPDDTQESATLWNVADDPRLSGIGRFLRRSSLDELPQLFNVLRGDMSLVGPRPERPHFVDQFRQAYPSYEARHRVPSGLTGWAQIHGLRGDTSIEDRARFDNYYIENWSLWLDVKIILRTVGLLLRGAGR